MPFELETAVGYRNFEEFNAAARQIDVYNNILRPIGINQTLADTIQAGHVANAWEMLVNTSEAPLQMVMLGRVSVKVPEANIEKLLDEDVGISLVESTPENSLLDANMHANFSIVTEFSKGSISWSNNWTLLMNDSLILGGIQKNLPFYLVSKRTPSNIWDSRFNRLTVTGRELVGLLTSGYMIGKMADGSEVLRNKSESPRGLALDEYQRAVNYFSRNRNWEVLARPDLYGIDFNFESNFIRDVWFL